MNNVYFVSRLLGAILKSSLYYLNYTIVFLIGILISCSQYSIDELLSVPEQIEIDSRKYILETGLYRNFQPTRPGHWTNATKEATGTTLLRLVETETWRNGETVASQMKNLQRHRYA